MMPERGWRKSGRQDVERRALDAAVVAIGRARPHLVDAWEAIAVAESLGYTDDRVRRELGLADARAFGEFAFEQLAQRPVPPRRPEADADTRGVLRTFADCLVATCVYPLAWLSVVVLNRIAPGEGELLRIALMLSLIATGGWILAMSRRGQFYAGMQQLRLATVASAYFIRLGAIAVLAAVGGGLILAWYAGWPRWPAVLYADEFVVLCALWLTCGALAIRPEPWRALAAAGVGPIAFVVLRLGGQRAMTAVLMASGAALIAAAVQLPRVFAARTGGEQAALVPVPRMAVVLFRALPFIAYGTLYFGLLFADGLIARATAGATPRPPQEFELGMDLAVTTFLLAAAFVEYANVRFARRLRDAAKAPLVRGSRTFGHAVGRIHGWTLITVVAGFIVMAGIVAAATKLLLRDAAPAVWTSLAMADIGFLLLAVGIANARVLFTLNRPWRAAAALTAGLAVSLAVGYATRGGAVQAVAGLLAAGVMILIQSAIAVALTLRRAEHAIAAL